MGSHRVGWRECRVRREKGVREVARGFFGGRGARRQCGDGNARGQLVRAAVLSRRRAGRRTSSRIVQRNVQRETEFFYLPLRVELPSEGGALRNAPLAISFSLAKKQSPDARLAQHQDIKHTLSYNRQHTCHDAKTHAHMARMGTHTHAINNGHKMAWAHAHAIPDAYTLSVKALPSVLIQTSALINQ